MSALDLIQYSHVLQNAYFELQSKNAKEFFDW